MLGRLFQRQTETPPDQAPAFPDRLEAADIRLTPAAQERMRRLFAEADPEVKAIRVYVTGGGCHGMTYGMTYAERLTPHDAVLETEGYRIAVDAVALNFLRGCTIDYRRQGLNESFVFSDVFKSVGGSGACGGCASAGSARY